MRKFNIKKTYEQWAVLREAIASDLADALVAVKKERNHEGMLLCALLHQILIKIDTKLVVYKDKFSISLSTSEAMGLHQAYALDIISPEARSLQFFHLQDIYLTIDREVFA